MELQKAGYDQATNTFTRILFSHKKGNLTIGYTMDEHRGHYGKWQEVKKN